MKRILHFGGVLLALGMLLASCNIGVGDGQVAGDSVRNTSNVEGIVLKVNKIDNSRTILPADWTADRAGSLTYVLRGKKHGEPGDYDPLKTFSYSELTGGTATVNLELTVWDLKLTGYMLKSGSTPEDDELYPCLEKELLNEDFSTGKKTVVFDLKPVETTDATGSVNVSIVWLTDKPKRLEFGIYGPNTTTDTIIDDNGRTKVIDSVETPSEKLNKVSTGFSGTGTHTLNFTAEDNIKAGIYKFAAVFYDNDDDTTFTGNVIGYYIDYLYIDGGNLSEAKIQYGDKFDTLPENPTWLAVETAYVPQELKSKTAPVYDWYYAKFHWNDVSTNETGFELVITEEGKEDDPYIVNPTEFAKTDFPLKADKWYDGTEEVSFPTTDPNRIDAGSTWVVLKLDTEKKYTAKIRAINGLTPEFAKAKPTDFCENLNRNGDGQGSTYAPIVGDDKQFGMFSVNYEIDKESTVVTKSGTTGTDITNYVVGFNYSNEQQDLMTDFYLDIPHLENDTQLFDHWQTTTENDEGEKEPMHVIEALNIDNLKLEPVWKGTDVSVHVTFPSYADAKDVKIAADQNSTSTVEFKYSTTNNSISVTAGASLTTPDFELSAVNDTGAIITTGTKVTGYTWTWTPTKAPTPGLYCLQITGKYKDAGSGRTLTLCGNVYIEVKN